MVEIAVWIVCLRVWELVVQCPCREENSRVFGNEVGFVVVVAVDAVGEIEWGTMYIPQSL